jgi:hypothetical protein
MATTKGQVIADYAISKIGCAYIWGGYGEKKCSPSFRRERLNAYPTQTKIKTYCPVLSGKQSGCTGCKWNGKQAYDCAQLTRYCCKAAGQELVSGANSQWKKVAWEKKGTIDTLPDVPGVILYHVNDKGTMSHTGVYIGDGYAVEARGHAYGVVKTAIKDRSWTHWAALPGVLTGEEVQRVETTTTTTKPTQTAPKQPETESVVFTMETLRKGSKGTQVKVLQFMLYVNGFECGNADGIFGAKTLAAVKAYQKAHGLTADGIVGRNTWTSILA